MRGTKIVFECLLEQGADLIFGYPGGANLALYDELLNYRGRIRHILTAHEQGAAHAADGYARATGKTGVCFATSGPGATNLVTGMAAAFMDSSPVVFITCNVSRSLIGRDSFQEVDITGIGMPITKANFLINSPGELAPALREAFAVASGGRKGPVLVDIPKDILFAETEFLPDSAVKYHVRSAYEPDSRDIEVFRELVENSSRPLIICGGGVIRGGAAAELQALAEAIGAPVCCTMMGLGGFPPKSPLFLGLAGMHGSKSAGAAVDACDLLIAVGTRFSDRVAQPGKKFAKNAKIVHIDIDRAEINKNIHAHHHITGDARITLSALNKAVKKRTPSWMAGRPLPAAAAGRRPRLSPAFIMDAIYKKTDGKAIIATDVGKHQVWCAQHYSFDSPGLFITSGGFGSMGFGMGASIGAKLGRPGDTVVLITGDGSFMMNCTELATMAGYGIPVVIILLNNRSLGMVRQLQDIYFEGRHSETDIKPPDFIKLAGAYGIESRRVRTAKGFGDALDAALERGSAFLIECEIDPDTAVKSGERNDHLNER